MPGVLTEIGFMSNPQELAYMKSEKGQAEIARSLFDAVREYSDHVLAQRRGDENASGGPMSSGGAEDAAASVEVAAGESDGAGAALATGDDAKRSAQSGKSGQSKVGTPKPEATASQRSEGAEAEVRYAVQVLAAPKALPLDSSQFRSYRGKVKQYAGSGALHYKYCVEECSSAARAQERLREVRKVFPDAFVVRCRDGRIVTQ